MPPGRDQGSDKDNPMRSRLGLVRFTKGKWYCECDKAAKCLTTKKSGPNNRRKFWICAKSKEEQCSFFLWVDDEVAAKEWLQASQPRSDLQTTSNVEVIVDLDHISDTIDERTSPQPLETPFTKAKRKLVSRSTMNLGNNDGVSRTLFGDSFRTGTELDDPFTDLNQEPEHARKAARTSILATPGQKFVERLGNGLAFLPTPNSRDHIPLRKETVTQPRGRDISPSPGQLSDGLSVNFEEDSELIRNVLELVRSDCPGLKSSTTIQLRHEIGLKLDLTDTRLRRYEGTISQLRKRLDELETIILNITGLNEDEVEGI